MCDRGAARPGAPYWRSASAWPSCWSPRLCGWVPQGGASLCFLGCPAACTCLQSGCDKRCGGQVTRKGLSPGVRPSSSVWACGRRLWRSVWCRGHQDPHGCGLLLGVKAYSRCGHTYPGLSVVRVVTRLAEVDSWRTVTLTHIHGNMLWT